jgi:hypothetical protein
MVVCRLFVLGCALVLMAFAAEPAMADPQPEAPPQPHSGSAHVQPVPAPSASGTNSSASTQVSSSTSTQVSFPTSTTPPLSTSVRTVPQSPVTAAHVRASSRPLHTRPRRHATSRQASRQQPPSLNSGWPTWLRGTTGLHELRSVGRAGGSSLPVAAGIALVLLVIAEASFLGLASSRLGRPDARLPARKRPADEPLAIRRVQLRR